MHSSGRLSDQTAFDITGRLPHCSVKLLGFRVNFEFLVADLPGLDVVLGLDFLAKYDLILRWRQRYMLLNDPRPANDTVYKIQACSRESLPHIQSDLIELCTMRQFADMCAKNDCSGDEVFVGFVRGTDSDFQRPEDDFLYSGKGGDHPDVQKVLSDSADVLVSKLPSGNPPESFGPDGKPIEHTIELAEATKPFAAQPRRLSQDEDAELQKVLKDLLANG